MLYHWRKLSQCQSSNFVEEVTYGPGIRKRQKYMLHVVRVAESGASKSDNAVGEQRLANRFP